MSMRTLHEKIGFIPQSAFLFSGTVADNLRMGKPDATEEEMWEALETAQAADFVKAMPDGLDSELSQNGKNLSGGQRQRLSIARAVLKNPDILILDEPTAVLTPQETEKLFSVIRNMKADGKAVIIITHKLHEVLSISDRVAILRKGE